MSNKVLIVCKHIIPQWEFEQLIDAFDNSECLEKDRKFPFIAFISSRDIMLNLYARDDMAYPLGMQNAEELLPTIAKLCHYALDRDYGFILLGQSNSYGVQTLDGFPYYPFY